MRSMKRFGGLAVAAAALIGLSAPASAIINGSSDGNAHPNVGGLVSSRVFSDGTWMYCSGTLIAPTVFLTAAHCGTEGQRVQVAFSSAYRDGDRTYRGTFRADPQYSPVQSDPHDIAVVVLDRPINNLTPSRLPLPGSLSSVTGSQTFTSVGYGAMQVVNAPGGKQYLYDDVRMAGVGTLNSVNPAWLRISMNAATGDAGTCYGDSGGPNFLGSSNVIAATTITGDAVCRATNVVYRLDTTSARNFLRAFVRLP